MKGININCSEAPYVEMILNGEKIIETRDSDSLGCYIGKRIGLVETGTGPSMLKGYATISTVHIVYTKATWDRWRKYHKVHDGSKYDFKDIKYCYVLDDIKRIEPIEIHTRGHISREVPDEREEMYSSLFYWQGEN